MRPQIDTILTFALTLCSIVPMLGNSPKGGPPAPTRGPGMPPPPELPINDFLPMLLVAAIALGVYWSLKLHAKKKAA